MKFIIDAQLPKSLSDFLVSKGLDSIHTLDLPEKNKTKDGYIAKLANKEERVVITKDADFLESFIVKSEPEKLIIVKTGNINNRHLVKLFEDNLGFLLEMISKSNLIEINRTEIIVHS